MDRAEVIQLSGYIDTEKLEIAKKYLIPRSLDKNGLGKSQVRYSNESLLFIANGYAREAGVRNFEKNLDKIHRKLATEMCSGKEERRENISRAKLIEKMLGKPIFRDEEGKKADRRERPWARVDEHGRRHSYYRGDHEPGQGRFQPYRPEGRRDEWNPRRSRGHGVKHYVTLSGIATPEWSRSSSCIFISPRRDAEGRTVRRHHDGHGAPFARAEPLDSPRARDDGELSLTGQVLPIGGLKEKRSRAPERREGYHHPAGERARS
jgi:ATP-dependent Lon protease